MDKYEWRITVKAKEYSNIMRLIGRMEGLSFGHDMEEQLVEAIDKLIKIVEEVGIQDN